MLKYVSNDMFDKLPSEINKVILSYIFPGVKCYTCHLIFRKGFYDKNNYHMCEKCASSIMYERGSWGFFEKCIYINNG